MSDREKLRRAERHRRSFTVDEWCDARRISRGMFYKLRDRGLAPKTHNVGTKVLISDDADAAWLRDREAESTTAVIGKSEAAA
jgi:hypothetical protein